MAYSSLYQYVQALEARGLLIRVKEFVDPVLEVTEVTDRFSKVAGGGKALLFENTGTQFPLLTNAFGSSQRVALALGISNPDEVGQTIDTLFKSLTLPRKSILDKLKALPQLRRVARWMPVSSSGRGECQQVIHTTPDLGILPVLKTWPHDGGRFITLPMVHTINPTTGLRNLGMYRMQIFSKDTAAMHWHLHKTGASHFREYKKLKELMPVAVTLGGDPAYTYSATAPLPENIDEYILAGFLRSKPVRLVRCITNDLEVPTDVDIVIEGYIDPTEELAWEGPFGDHTGFYSLADWYPTLHVTCITHRKNAIYPATIVGVPPMEDAYMAKVTERIFLSPIKLAIAPEVKDMNLPPEGAAHNLTIVSIEKTYPGQAHKIANAMWGAGQMMFNKVLAVVDSDVNIHDPLILARMVSDRFNPSSGYFIGHGPLDVLDHAVDRMGVGGKLLIDATEPLPGEDGAAKRVLPSAEQLSKALSTLPPGAVSYSSRLVELGISLLVVGVNKTKGFRVKDILNSVASSLAGAMPKVLVAVEEDFFTEDSALLCWYVLGNIDPQRDCYTLGTKDECCLAVDGTSKCYHADAFPRPWPSIVVSSPQTIKSIDERWNSLGLGDFIPSPSTKLLTLSNQNGATAVPMG